MKPETFGHTGFTGTCVWVDPKHDLVYIFLSNRVYPTRDNGKLSQMLIRGKIQDAIYRALGECKKLFFTIDYSKKLFYLFILNRKLLFQSCKKFFIICIDCLYIACITIFYLIIKIHSKTVVI